MKSELFELATTSANGTLQTSVFNRNRNSAKTATCKWYKTPTVTSDGTRIALARSGTVSASSRVGGENRSAYEWILKQTWKYVTARLLRLIGDGKVGGGDLVRLMGMLNDRVDGKVADRVEVSGEVKEERSITVRFVRGGAEMSKDALGGLVDGGRAAEVVDG